jgi:uncharacterized protein YeaO (DUF488 family)
MGSIHLKRIYEPADKHDGKRVLVDRLWPRGLKKETAQLDEWMKNVAPSTELRKWFHQDTSRWDEFRLKYLHELKQNDAVNALLELAKHNHQVTLLYAAHDEQHNHAQVLQHFITEKLK